MKIKPIKLKKIPLCDCHTGVDYSSRTPHILSCKNPAVHVVKFEREMFGKKQDVTMYVCEQCLPRVQKAYG
jgi:hypothetical protein